MQIEFELVRFKNLLSYGNAETTIVLNQHKNTIITGTNGSGKSAGVLDGICYALFNKPYRKITLGQLVNSVNRKALLVTVQFRVGHDAYTVIRGQKPSVFEIWKNGEIIKEDAASKDYQGFLENEILRMNFKTFKQLVVIGSANYIPFMDLTAADRRAVTEDVLDISIFSAMLEQAKRQLSESKSLIDALTYEISLLKNQIDSQKTLLTSMETEAESNQSAKESRIAEIHDVINQLNDELASIDPQIEELNEAVSKHETLSSNKEKLERQIYKLESKIADFTKQKTFYDHDACPTCTQTIAEDVKITKQNELNDQTTDVQRQLDVGNRLLTEFIEKLSAGAKSVQALSTLVQRQRTILADIKAQQKLLSTTSVDVISQESITMCRDKLKELVTTLVDKSEQKNQTSKDQEYYKVCVEILKDTGIKAKIISTFIPIMNELINDYLQKFDMFVSFELDEMFNETIKSRNRDVFTYNSFSEGEKMRISLSILFAWRKIAATRNSVSTNLLIFDETLDQSLDEESVDTFTHILESMEDGVNTIVVSHRSIIPELFDRHIRVFKQRDFSILETNA